MKIHYESHRGTPYQIHFHAATGGVMDNYFVRIGLLQVNKSFVTYDEAKAAVEINIDYIIGAAKAEAEK